MNQHILKSHKNRKFQCPECESDYTTAFRLRQHVKKNHGNKKINIKSTIIIVGRREVKIAPEAKSDLIRAQKEKIDKLKLEILKAEQIGIELSNQLQAEAI